MANKIIHKHSAVVNGNVAKLPSPEMLEYGELAVNYAVGNETVSFKNNNDEIVTIRTNEYLTEIIEENELITAEALINLDNRVIDLENAPDPETYFVLNTSYMQDEESSAAVFASLEEAYYAGKMIVLANTADESEFVLPTTVSKEDDGTFVFMVSTVDCTAASANFTTLYYIISPTGVEVSEDSSSMSLLKDGEGNKFLNDRGEYTEIVVDQELSTTSENPISNKAVATTISNVEHVVASALTDLDGRIIELESEPSVTKVSDLVNDLGFITAEDALPAQTYLEVTHQELVDLKNSSQLIPGTKYRITDYVTKFNSTVASSKENPFDVVVTALDVNVLDHKANAVHRAGDNYFTDCDLSKWQLWYDLEYSVEASNSIVADFSTNEALTGIVINMEFSGMVEYMEVNYYAYEGVIQGITVYVLSETQITNVEQDILCVLVNPDDSSFIPLDYAPNILEVNIGNSENYSKGLIYRMIDEFNNDCPYDFKNIQFDAKFTFSYAQDEDSDAIDASLTGKAYLNKIHPCIDHKTLPRNVFFITGDNPKICNNEVFEDATLNMITNSNAPLIGITNISIGKKAMRNTIDVKISSTGVSTLPGIQANIKIGDCACDNNVAGYDIEIGIGSSNNTVTLGRYARIGNYSNRNSIPDSERNIIGDYCDDNTIQRIGFGPDCNLITSNSCNNTIIGAYNVVNNTSDNNYIKGSYNIFNTARNNTVIGGSNVFEPNASGNVVYGEHNTFKQHAANNSFKTASSNGVDRYQVNSVTVSEDCCNNVFWNAEYDQEETDLEDAFDRYYMKNIFVTKGINDSVVNIPYLNAEYEVKVAKNSAGEINVYCEEDRIAALEAALANAALVAKVSASEYQEMVNNGTANDEYLYVITEDDTTEA